MLQPHDFFDLRDSSVGQLFEGCDYVWQALTNLETSVKRLVNESRSVLGEVMEGAYLSDRAIYIDRDARIEPGAYILGPAYIGQGAVVRHGAFIRENVIMLAGSVLGHASEAKQSIMLPYAHAVQPAG